MTEVYIWFGVMLVLKILLLLALLDFYRFQRKWVDDFSKRYQKHVDETLDRMEKRIYDYADLRSGRTK